MAYINQQKKAEISALVKPILKKYNLKGSLSIAHNSRLTLMLASGSIDFVDNLNKTCGADHYQVINGFEPVKSSYMDVNPFHYHRHFSGCALECMQELIAALNNGNYDNSDLSSDYFDVGWHIGVKIGKWNKPYSVAA